MTIFNNSPLISIIMPIYNSANLLRKSIENVINQTLSNWELILVDDGSTDNSNDICQSYTMTDERIKLYRRENSGPASARNFGLDHAIGRYCLFIDSDDYLEVDAVETLNSIISQKEYDIVFFGYCTNILEEEEYIKKEVKKADERYFDNNLEFREYFKTLVNLHLSHPVWNKMFNVEVLKKRRIRFPEGLNISEDFVFNLQLFVITDSVFITPHILYNYVNHQTGSITTKFSEDRIMSIHKLYAISSKIINEWDPRLIGVVENEYIKNISVYINSMFNADCDLVYREKRKKVVDIINNDMLQGCLSRFDPSNARNRIFSFLLKSKNIDLILLTGKLARFKLHNGVSS